MTITWITPEDANAKANDASARTPALLGNAGHKNYRSGVWILALGFLGVFGGFQAAQGLQTSLNDTLGFINLACLYTTFTTLCIVAPPMLASLEKLVGLNWIMLLSGCAYFAMVSSNVYIKHWALPITMSILVGIAAPLLWTCQNVYLGRCAYHAANQQTNDEGPHSEPVSIEVPADLGDTHPAFAGEGCKHQSLESMTAQFNSLFFSIYQFAGMTGNILASTIMLAFSSKKWLKDVLFCVLGCISLVGSAVFLLMPRVEGIYSGGDNTEHESLKATIALAVRNKKMRLMIPVIFTNGMTLAFIFGDFPKDIVCPVAGTNFTGFVTATFFGVNAVATLCWGKLIASNTLSRISVYAIAMICELAFFLVKTLWHLWHHPTNYEEHDHTWHEVHHPAWFEILAVFGLVALFAIGDAFWESGPPATLQNYFMGTPSITPAMANLKLWQSLGMATQFIIGATLGSHPVIRAVILISCLTISIVSLLVLDCAAPLK